MEFSEGKWEEGRREIRGERERGNRKPQAPIRISKAVPLCFVQQLLDIKEYLSVLSENVIA